MIHFESVTSVQYLFFALMAVGTAMLLFIGYRLGRWVGTIGASSSDRQQGAGAVHGAARFQDGLRAGAGRR
jgi:threonine/homoserine/homoserine lactone efflux protein